MQIWWEWRSFKYIGARRNVDNAEVGNTLSAQSSEIYKTQEVNDEGVEAKEETIGSLKFIFAALPLLGSAIGIAALFFYKIDEDLIKKNSAILESRRKGEETTTAVAEKGNSDIVY